MSKNREFCRPIYLFQENLRRLSVAGISRIFGGKIHMSTIFRTLMHKSKNAALICRGVSKSSALFTNFKIIAIGDALKF